ncbi:MAG: ornithine cyclodeaminase family protein [bacterium]|nr:ornithine cyclodeaminase family protein [bacterium]
MSTSPTTIAYLTRDDIERFTGSHESILEAVETGLKATASDDAVVEPTVYVKPQGAPGGMATIRGAILSQGLIGIKTVGSYPDNRNKGLPPDPGFMALFDLETGIPRALLDGAPITTIRTAAMTALGARYLARSRSRVLAHIGARGIAAWGIRFLDSMFELDEIRLLSRTRESLDAAIDDFGNDLRAMIVRTDSWEDCVADADIVVDGSSRTEDAVLLPTSAIKPGATVIVYGAFSCFDDDVFGRIDKVFVDRWQDYSPGQMGAMMCHMARGHLTREGLSGFLGDLAVAGRRGRSSDDEIILFWHRGLAPCDITLANFFLDSAAQTGSGRVLPYP